MGVEGVLLLLPAFVGLLYGEKSGACFLFPATILALIYIIFGIRKPNKTRATSINRIINYTFLNYANVEKKSISFVFDKVILPIFIFFVNPAPRICR